MAKANTKLIIVDNLISFACHDPSNDKNNGILGAASKEAPKPLLANYGIVNEVEYTVDLTVCNFLILGNIYLHADDSPRKDACCL